MFVKRHSKWTVLVAVLMVGSLILSACGEAEPEVVEKVVTQVVKETVVVEATAEVVEKEVTKVVEVEKVVTATPESKVGGTFVVAVSDEPRALDAHKTTTSTATRIASFMGSALIAKDPNGNYVPWLAESWSASEDGLNWDFTLRKDVKFHDGTPLTAHEYAWTFQRMLDPELMSKAASIIGPLVSAEALDDYTLRLTLSKPFFPLLDALTAGGYFQPLPPEAVERLGDDFSRQPVGVGPYKFKSWTVGDRVVLERNPDFNWQPGYAQHEGPFYIETIVFRFIPETATIMAGLEAGDIDAALIEPKDVERIEGTGAFQIFEATTPCIPVLLMMNVSQPPFDDLRVRQAFYHAVDREALIKVVEQGLADPHLGPLSKTVSGYWSGLEEITHGHDLDLAKALMQEAGFTEGPNGMLEKGGEPLKLTMRVGSESISDAKLAEVLQDQLKGLGVEVEIQLEEFGSLFPELAAGNYELTTLQYNYADADILHIAFHSSNLYGGWNVSHIHDDTLDELLSQTQTATDPDERQEAVEAAATRIVEQAYVVPLYARKMFWAVDNRVKGAFFSPLTSYIVALNDAYIEE